MRTEFRKEINEIKMKKRNEDILYNHKEMRDIIIKYLKKYKLYASNETN